MQAAALRRHLPAGDTDPRIDLGADGTHIRILDVNNDHLIDVVRTTGTAMQTWLNLGYLPGGDGRFGSYLWNGTDYDLSTQPFESCLLHAGTPIDFDDPEVRLADLNGDGLQDIVKVRRGRVIYWPGRGEGVWGDGSRRCARGEGADRYIEMTTPPLDLAIDLDGVHLADVNMDGATDIVQVRFREVDVYFNRAGEGWTPRTTVTGTPATPSFSPRVRLADIDGSSTTDLIWGNAHAWQFLDFSDGQRPRLLVGVHNGLGGETTIDYASSAVDYLQDLQAADSCTSPGCDRFTWTHRADGPDARLCDLSGQASTPRCSEDESQRGEWLIRSSGSPVISTVVRSVTTTDHLDRLGRAPLETQSQFAYHDGYYEGIEQEYRGFGAADAVSVGDWNNPTVYSRTHFLQGRRPHSLADDRLANNPYEALKGREYMTETFDGDGAFSSTSWATITDRRLATGLDGRAIHYAYVSEVNELRYDTTPFEAPTMPETIAVDLVRTEAVDPTTGAVGGAVADRMTDIVIRGLRAARIRGTYDAVDNLGHVHQQTAHGEVDVGLGTAIDGTMTGHTSTELVNDREWIWRQGSQYLTGHDAPGPLGQTTFTYNAVGDELSRTTAVTSTTTYDFGSTLSQTDEDLLSSAVYDRWGNSLASCAGHVLGESFSSFTTPPTDCLRFGHVEYDTDYAQLAEHEHVRVRAAGQPYDVQSVHGTWDRGLGAITSVTDPNGLTSEVTQDGFGRLTSVLGPNVGGCTGVTPGTRIEYELTPDPIAQPISRVITRTEMDCDGALGNDELVGIAYVDGLGATRATLSTGDTSAWVRSGITVRDKKGTVRRAYQEDFYDATDTDFASVLALPEVPYAVARYDAFGRLRGVHAEDGAVMWLSYHALSADVCDPLDNDPSSEHYRTCTTIRTDGHGRTVDQIQRNRNPDTGAPETYRLWNYYRADGAVLAMVRAQSDATVRPATWTTGLPTDSVVRTFAYDSVGRRLSSDDPDTDNLLDPSQTTNSWRYLFNRVGDIAAVRDPRGCGQDFYYDFGGRLVGEQYVGCGEAQSHDAEQPHADNTVGDLIGMDYDGSTNRALDVQYHYDDYPGWADALTGADAIPPAAGTIGHATGVTDRAQRAAIAYDDRGNAIWTARQMALISDELGLGAMAIVDGRPQQAEDAPTGGNVLYDETNTYIRTATFDHANRARSMTLPRDPDYDDVDPAPTVGGLITYTSRGLPRRAAAFIGCNPGAVDTIAEAEMACSGAGGSVQRIVESIAYERDGLVSSTTFGDGVSGGRAATVSSTTYDIRRRPVRFRTTRAPTGTTPESLAAVTTVVDQQLVWDAANNLTAQIDHRDAAEWPAGHRPQTVHMRHDSLYRVIGAEYDYTQTDGSRTPVDMSTDWRDSMDEVRSVDPMYQRPAPMASSQPTGRVASLTWTWDYLANTTAMGDDASSFYERSLGAIANGDDLESTRRPSALYLATNIGSGADLDGGSGWVEVDYGVGGNVVGMTVHSQCGHDTAESETCADPGGASLQTRLDDLRDFCVCAVEQHYVYRWDELNRLAEARRYDKSVATGGAWSLQVRQRYRYDSGNSRTIKQTLDEDEGVDPPQPGMIPRERIALSIYPGDFERRGLVRGFSGYEANEELGTETQYLVAGARTVWKHGTAGGGYERDHRFTVALGDLISTTAAVLDVRTGELLEASTYYPNGARETLLVDDDPLTEGDARTAPEPMGFTGKEADSEVGLVYFGERYLIPRLGRWASPDPLHVHASGGGEVLNSFHYVAGNLLVARDPLGLDYGEWSGSFDDGGGRQIRVRESDGSDPSEADMHFDETRPTESQVGALQRESSGIGFYLESPAKPEGALPELSQTDRINLGLPNEAGIRTGQSYRRGELRGLARAPADFVEGVGTLVSLLPVSGAPGAQLLGRGLRTAGSAASDAIDEAVLDAMPVSSQTAEEREREDLLAEVTSVGVQTVAGAGLGEVMGAGSAASSAAGGGGADIALGLTRGAHSRPGALRRFADAVGARPWTEWAEAGLTHGNPGHFGEQFGAAAARARTIRFNLDGIDDVAAAVQRGSRGFGPRNMTNAELFHLAQNPSLLAKTVFYRAGQVVASPF